MVTLPQRVHHSVCNVSLYKVTYTVSQKKRPISVDLVDRIGNGQKKVVAALLILHTNKSHFKSPWHALF